MKKFNLIKFLTDHKCTPKSSDRKRRLPKVLSEAKEKVYSEDEIDKLEEELYEIEEDLEEYLSRIIHKQDRRAIPDFNADAKRYIELAEKLEKAGY